MIADTRFVALCKMVNGYKDLYPLTNMVAGIRIVVCTYNVSGYKDYCM